MRDPDSDCRYFYLKRRARHLERELSKPEGQRRPGVAYDAGEYSELQLAFRELGVEFTAAGKAPGARGAPDAPGDTPPRLDALDTPPPRRGRRVPFPPRGRMFTD